MLTFWNSWGTRVIGGIFAIVAIFLLGVAVSAGRVPVGYRICFTAGSAAHALVGSGRLRSKVVVDGSGIHIRRAVGWLHIDWSSPVGFVVERSTSKYRDGRWVVAVVRPGRPAIRPHALTRWDREHAEVDQAAIKAIQRSAVDARRER